MKYFFSCTKKYYVVVLFLFLIISYSIIASSRELTHCPDGMVFSQSFNNKHINKLLEMATRLEDCSEPKADRYRYFIARAMYDVLISSKREKDIGASDYNEILQIHPEFWAALADLGDINFQKKKYVKALKYYERALLDLDMKIGELAEIRQEKDNIPAKYILELKAKADNARLLASSAKYYIEPIRARGEKLAGMHSFRIRGVEVKDHKYPLYFEYNSAELVTSNPYLDLLVEALQSADEPDIRITGHTDYIGSDIYNIELSQQRAESLKAFLKNEKKYKGKIKAIGKGEKAIVKMHSLQRKNLSDEEWRRLNRRVEIHLDENLAAKTYALIIGINNYDKNKKFSNLKGAVNDANLIYNSLTDTGISSQNLIKLIDKQASKKVIISSWNKLINDSKPDDTLIFSFAGHGTQEFDQNGDEKLIDPEDDYDETLLLSNFAETSIEAQNERLVDDEIYLLLKKATSRKIIYLVDSCHSGGTPRSIDKRAISYSWTTRAAPPSSVVLSIPSILNQENSFNRKKELDLDNFYMFAATESRKSSLEGVIDGKPYGALSWAFSQSLKEAHLRNKPVLSFNEMANYIKTEVRNLTENRQFVDIQARGDGDTILFTFSKNHEEVLQAKRKESLVIAINGDRPEWINNYKDIDLSHNKNGAEIDFIWDTNKGDILNKQGDITAYNINTKKQFEKIINRIKLIKVIDQVAKFHFIESQLSTFGDRDIYKGASLYHFSYCEDCQKCDEQCIAFNISELKYNYLYQFNITGNGIVQCFSSEKVNRRKEYEFNASPPAGQDTLITLVTKEESEELQQLIGNEDSCSTAKELINKLPLLLKDKDYQIGRIDTYTGR